MKIADPTAPRPRRRQAGGCRRVSCGCLLAGGVLALLAPFLLSWLLSGPSVRQPQLDLQAAERFQEKIDELGRYYDPATVLRSELLPTTALSETELNSFLTAAQQRLRGPAADGLQAVAVELEDGYFVVHAELIPTEFGSGWIETLPWPFRTHTRVDLRGALQWVEGKGSVTLETVKLGKLSLPGSMVLDWIPRFAPEAEAWIELSKGFPLPFGTRGLAVQRDRILLEGS
jgi:hypothetical protein